MSGLGPLRVILTVQRGSDVLTTSRDASGVVGPGREMTCVTIGKESF